VSLADELTALLKPIVQQAVREALAGLPPADGAEPLPEYLSFARAGQLVDVSPKTIAAWVRRGWLVRYGPKGAERVRTSEVRALMAKHADATAVEFEDQVRRVKEKLR
jgi:hypothetical protein